MTLWQVLEREFRDAFINYAVQERVHDEIHKLKMKGGNVDQYIAEFQQLAHRANLNVNDAGNTRMFAARLPFKLAETCIDISHPRTFAEWAKAA